MKWVLIGVLIVVIMLIAFSLSEQYKDRYDFYLNLKQFLAEFKINVAFKQDKLDKFLATRKSQKSFKLFVDAYSNFLKTNQLDLSSLKLLDEVEKQNLTRLILSIGKFDKSNEISQLDGFLLVVEGQLKTAEASKAKMCPMIIKLSLLFALAVAVLLI